jgi:hypothetical protein
MDWDPHGDIRQFFVICGRDTFQACYLAEMVWRYRGKRLQSVTDSSGDLRLGDRFSPAFDVGVGFFRALADISNSGYPVDWINHVSVE